MKSLSQFRVRVFIQWKFIPALIPGKYLSPVLEIACKLYLYRIKFQLDSYTTDLVTFAELIFGKSSTFCKVAVSYIQETHHPQLFIVLHWVHACMHESKEPGRIIWTAGDHNMNIKHKSARRLRRDWNRRSTYSDFVGLKAAFEEHRWCFSSPEMQQSPI